MQNLYFDTLEYSSLLKKGGVDGDLHANALQYALRQNTYTRNEVDTMFRDLLDKLDQRMQALENRLNNAIMELSKRMTYELNIQNIKIKEIENHFEVSLRRHTYATIGILGTFITFIGALSTFAHSFFH